MTTSNKSFASTLRRLNSGIDRKSNNNNNKPAVAMLAACLLFLLVLWPIPYYTTPAEEKTSKKTNQPPAFSLLVTLKFTQESYKLQFLQDFAVLAAYVRQYESETTLAYEALMSDQDPLQVLILERYQDKERSYLQIHKSSAAFQTFRPKLQALQDAGHVTISGHSYLDSGLGGVGGGGGDSGMW